MPPLRRLAKRGRVYRGERTASACKTRGAQPRPDAGAQRTLDGLGYNEWFGKALA